MGNTITVVMRPRVINVKLAGLLQVGGGGNAPLQQILQNGNLADIDIVLTGGANFIGDGSQLTNLPAPPTPTLQAVTAAGATTDKTIESTASSGFKGNGSELREVVNPNTLLWHEHWVISNQSPYFTLSGPATPTTAQGHLFNGELISTINTNTIHTITLGTTAGNRNVLNPSQGRITNLFNVLFQSTLPDTNYQFRLNIRNAANVNPLVQLRTTQSGGNTVWEMFATINGINTTTITGTTPLVLNTNYSIRFVLNKNLSYSVFINGVLLGTITTNIDSYATGATYVIQSERTGGSSTYIWRTDYNTGYMLYDNPFLL